jgi:benzylsuccinate CoA-transferase BbsF subunit
MGGKSGARFMSRLVKWLDEEGLADESLKQIKWEEFQMIYMGQEVSDRLREHLCKFFTRHLNKELLEGSISRGVHIYPVLNAKEILEFRQLIDRGFWVKIDHPELDAVVTYPGAFAKFSETPCQLSRRAPLIGEHNEEIYCGELGLCVDEKMWPKVRNIIKGKKRAGCMTETGNKVKKALEGIKVADFSWVIAGPFATKYLADHGATVIRIESAEYPDILRYTQPFKHNRPSMDRSGFLAHYNSSKYSVSLNLPHPRAQEVVKRLVTWTHIVVENFRPNVMKSWRLNYEELVKIKPDITMLSPSNQGQTGPSSAQPGFGVQLTSLSGFTYLTGWPDRDPAGLFQAYTDFISDRFAAIALLAALDYKRKTGKGQYIDVSQIQCGLQLLAPILLDYTINGRVWSRVGNHCNYAAPHGVYTCKGDDNWCTIAVFTEEEWQGLCDAMGNPQWTRDSKFATLDSRLRNEEELNRLIEDWSSQYTPKQVMTLLQAVGVASRIVNTAEKVFSDIQLRHRQQFQVLNDGEPGPFSFIAPPFRLSLTRAELRPSPCLGEHNEYVCTNTLGMRDEEFVELVEAGLFG